IGEPKAAHQEGIKRPGAGIGVQSKREKHFWELIPAQRVGAFHEFHSGPTGRNCFRDYLRGSRGKMEYRALARAGSMMARDRSDGASRGQSPPDLAAQNN